ncbi:sulfite reductase, subunit C [Desulfofarcimen acetoxidans DSM 771]|uniref:Sulfite reductase, subunit C n=1 Tax=Desulfofarcimen acetoxidans (strain ATCC 49208 / DSM 771 / KCTC 5769 / VKM B-1644 / 5575) TaxID=485916 RepID=C8VWB0_DESAS|nr:sulfite reductase subunit C [Desulfofarcimen acetoxidans]ACV62462.1 sulfite reductase, subunit C [Desulfofarcimen acetoxidans DSM 771]
MSVNTKKLIKNAYRITKERGITALRIRVPGGCLDVKYFDIIKKIAEKYGDGTVHITTRQGFEVPGISMNDIDEINEIISPILQGMEKELGVEIDDTTAGYPAAGTRNVSACIGNKVCPFANYNTAQLAQKIESLIYPNDYHVKIAVSGCPNDCIKAHMQDVGIMGMVEPVYRRERCIGCKACVSNCSKVSAGALSFINYKVERDEKRCIGCGECILKCPSSAWVRGDNYYRVVIMGRTGKKNPRIARPFLEWVTEDVVLSVIKNMYSYIERHIDKSLPKEHVGYIVDRTGFQVFSKEVLDNVELGEKAKSVKFISFGGYENDSPSRQ